ncbi:uncharacterized protein BO95DRAFT_441066 [Aspergillus brunneoviolaceus CBS 621.78]|uniref:Uncharacterized protein n=1 Tax=Aspergillus brunneoviolaceus CBS 621.78 TaxID=1450534 RepID=A0ACD1GE20_9EURO|nr:hypothetical protein BO95DRAFT_441066 [Aspergillus brunneoviolaceus CBS 621.78]RAH47534.1 hypothetical protein BO95DRAFT_441066 [Aspergillus brunneoviolaceus CBS 621.78]
MVRPCSSSSLDWRAGHGGRESESPLDSDCAPFNGFNPSHQHGHPVLAITGLTSTCTNSTNPSSVLSSRMDIRGSNFPHSKAAIYNNMEGDHHRLLRGELLILLRVMLGRLRKRPLLEYMIAPVFMVSFMGKRARAIEAYYDGQLLILRRTAFYSFPAQISPTFKELGEWYYGNPTGNTL